MITVALKPKELNEILDPRQIGFVNDFYLLENITSRLVSINEDGTYKLELASKIEEVAPLEYSIEINESYFSNGERISIEDVYNSFLRILNNGSSHVNLKEVVNSISINDKKLIVKLIKSSKSFFYYLSLPDLGILHISQYSKPNIFVSDFISVASGPFHIGKSGNSFLLSKNNYQKIYKNDYPSTIKLVNPFGKDVGELILKGEVDLGQIGIESFFQHQDQLLKKDNLVYLGIPSDALTYISFNRFSSKKWSLENRKWLKCLLEENFKVPTDLSKMARRSFQYFPPESLAYIEEDSLKEINKICPLKKPENFPENIVIHTYKTIFKVSIKKIIDELKNIPSVNISVIPDIETSESIKKMKDGDFDLFINVMSTDFRMPVEAINFEYFSPDARFHDRDGKIRVLFDKYQQAKDNFTEQSALHEITKVMNNDIDFIPLFHAAIPYFYNLEKVSLNSSSHLFVMNFWKLRAK